MSNTQTNLVQKPTKDVTQVANIVEKFRRTRANVLTIASFIDEVPPDHRLVVRVIEFDRRDFFSTGSGRYAPSKRALEQIASAMGVLWRHDLCTRVDNRADPNYAEFTAAAAAPDPQTGVPRIYKASYAADLRDGSAQTQEILSKRNGERQLQQKRKFIVSLADTGARLRVIRQLAPVRSDYTEQEIAAPFVCVAMIYQPGMDDPEIRRMMAVESFRARQALYYGASPDALPMEIPSIGTTYDPDDVEVFGGQVEQSEPEPLYYFNVEGDIEQIELDVDVFATLPRDVRVALTEEIIKRADYDLEDAFSRAGKEPKSVDDLSNPALLRLYCVCLDKVAPTEIDEDDIPF